MAVKTAARDFKTIPILLRFEACHDVQLGFGTLLCVLRPETWQDGMYRASSSTVRVES